MVGTILSYYTGGVNGWGTMIMKCATCGEIVAEYECDDMGVPTEPIFDNIDTHICEEDE